MMMKGDNDQMHKMNILLHQSMTSRNQNHTTTTRIHIHRVKHTFIHSLSIDSIDFLGDSFLPLCIPTPPSYCYISPSHTSSSHPQHNSSHSHTHSRSTASMQLHPHRCSQEGRGEKRRKRRDSRERANRRGEARRRPQDCVHTHTHTYTRMCMSE